MRTPGPSEPTTPISEADRELLRQRALRYARRAAVDADQVSAVMIFVRGASRYAVPLAELREVRALRNLCLIPGAKPTTPGVVHHRGALLSVHDLVPQFGGHAAEEARWLVVVEHRGERLGLTADEVVGVAPILAATVGQVPVTLGAAGVVLSGVLADGTLVVHPPALFSHEGFFSAF